MSTAGKRALTSLKDFTHAPNSSAALEKLLYGEGVNYDGLRKMLKNIGEEKPERLSKSQVTRTVERYFKSGTFTLNSIRRAVGVPRQDDEDMEEKEEEEEEEQVMAKKPAAKANTKFSFTAPTKGGGKKRAKTAAAELASAEPERQSSGVLAYISNLFSPSKK